VYIKFEMLSQKFLQTSSESSKLRPFSKKCKLKERSVKTRRNVTMNPLDRMEELGTRRFGVICDFEAVVVPSPAHLEKGDWCCIATEESLATPTEYQLRVAFRKHSTHAISQIFHWSADPSRLVYLVQKKSDMFRQRVALVSRVSENLVRFLSLLRDFDVPCALYSSQLRTAQLVDVLRDLNLEEYFIKDVNAAGVIGYDYIRSGLPDTETFIVAGNLISRSPSKCIIISDNNLAIEAAAELGAKSIIVSEPGTRAAWDSCSASMVVPSLACVSFRNLQNIFSLETYES